MIVGCLEVYNRLILKFSKKNHTSILNKKWPVRNMIIRHIESRQVVDILYG